MSRSSSPRPPIAIVGMGAIFPQSIGVGAFWNNIVRGNDLLTPIPATHWLLEDYYHSDLNAPDMTYAQKGGFLPDVDFDPIEWGVPPSIIEATDTTQLLALIIAKKCMEEAHKGDFSQTNLDRISCILGATSAQELLINMGSRLQHPIWRKVLREHGLPESQVEKICNDIAGNYTPWVESTFPGLLGNVIAGRIANRLNLGGTNCVTDAACASAFSAIQMAVNELYLGDSDLVLAGGTDTMNDIFMHMCFSKTPALSKSGDCRPFSDQADGTLLGEGLCIFALKRLDDAERDGNDIYALLKGIGSSSDGRSKSVYAPLPQGQAKAIVRAYERADIPLHTVELIEAHGTGTKAGDAAEFEGLSIAFAQAPTRSVALGSVKAQIGHTKAAAGAAGLCKAVLALRDGVLPPTIKVDAPNSLIDVEKSPLYVNTESRPWVRGSQHPRRAGVSSFGFGGSNFHIALEEYTGPNKAPRFRAHSHELLVFSAADVTGLAQTLQDWRQRKENALCFMAWASQQAFAPTLAHKISIVAKDLADAHSKIDLCLGRLDKGAFSAPNGIQYTIGSQKANMAFLFPGQGSQYCNMGSELARSFSRALSAWDDADSILPNTSFSDVVFPPPVFDEQHRKQQQEYLTQTQWAQPSIGLCSQAQLRMMQALGIQPDAVAGHSYGELSALHAAGVLDARDFVRVSRKRGELMAEVAQIPGAMSAVKGSSKDVQALLDQWKLDVVIANQNSPRQVVISGATSAIAEAESKLQEAGLFSQRLPVSTAFHSHIVAPAVEPFAKFLKGVQLHKPKCAVYANKTAQVYSENMIETLSKQIAHSVRFVDMIEQMYLDGIRVFVEVGPKFTLSKLAGQILRRKKDVRIVSLNTGTAEGLFAFLQGIGQLCTEGFAMNFSALWEGFSLPSDPEKEPKMRMKVAINGTNYNKPYPPKGGASALPKPNPERPKQVVHTAAPAQKKEQPKPQTEFSKNQTHSIASHPEKNVTKPNTPSPEWLNAFQTAQQQTAQAHASYQQAMSNAHIAYLQAAQSALNALANLSGTTSVYAPPPVAQAAQVAPVSVPSAPVSVPTPIVAQAPVPVPAEAPPQVHMTKAIPAPVVQASPVAAPAVRGSSVDLTSLLLSVVAEKTGYPSDMLNLEMSLEGDLGIDSIKRVEILSAMQEQAPSLPEVDAGAMASLQTLSQIVDHLQQIGGNADSVVSASSATPVVTNSASSVDLTSLLLSVVAEKTGYPSDMLNLEMSLEGDLGIDSIKRVEILSAMQEQAPSLPEVDAGAMASLQTLAQIVAYLEGSVPSVPSSSAPKASSTDDVFSIDLSALLLSVVAEKTGYPSDMLTLEMSLEGDLGIDSIKRVEILSAMQEQAPSLPEVDAGAMASLQTLSQIVDHMRRASGNFFQAEASQSDVSADTNTEIDSFLGLRIPRARVMLQECHARELSAPQLWSSVFAIIPADLGIAEPLANLLMEQGITAEVCTQPHTSHTGVIDLRALCALSSIADAKEQLLDMFATAKDIAPRALSYIVVQNLGGNYGLSTPTGRRSLQAGVGGLVRTAAVEWPHAHCKLIDIGFVTGEEAAYLLCEEICFGGCDIDVALCEGERSVLVLDESLPEWQEDVFLQDDDVIIVSGGARGVTASCVVGLAQQSSAYFALLGRTKMELDPCPEAKTDAEVKRALLALDKTMTPKKLGKTASHIFACREIEDTLARIHEQGGRAEYFSVDVCDAEAVNSIVAGIRAKEGAITGVIHGAGVLADKKIIDKTPSDFEWVYSVKVDGLHALMNATEQDSLRLLCLFSSVAARSGNHGQCDYAAANEVLNKIALDYAHNNPECLVKSLGWGPWDGGMVSPSLKAHFEKQGVSVIPIDAGVEALSLELRDSDSVEIVLGHALIPQKKTQTYAVVLDPVRHSFLQDHAIDGQVVVPMAQVLSLFRSAVLSFVPTWNYCRLKDVQVLKGIKLGAFSNPKLFSIALEYEGDHVSLRLLHNEQALYKAKAYSQPFDIQIPSIDSQAPVAEIYRGPLFHGSHFRVLQTVQSPNAVGTAAQLKHNIDSIQQIDAGLQLALLWTEAQTQQHSVPMKIAEVVWGESQATSCRLIGAETTKNRASSHAYLMNEQGGLSCALLGVETFLRPRS